MTTAIKQVELSRVSARFGKLQALEDVSLAIAAGQCVGLAGPNGCGKSTLIRVLLGLVRPLSAVLRIDGAQRCVDNAFKSQIGYLPESVAFSENLSGRQVLRFFAHARGVSRARVAEVLELVGLTEAARRPVRGYSRGMRQRLGLGLAVLSEPALLVLDEPTGGLDQQGLAVLREVLEQWRERKRLVLVATHDLALMEPHLDRICLLRGGRVLADAPPASLRRRARLPVRVIFTLDAERADAALERLVEEVRCWPGSLDIERRADSVGVTVAPDDLLALVTLQRPHEHIIRTMRVLEPALHDVYDELMRVSEDDLLASVAAASGGKG